MRRPGRRQSRGAPAASTLNPATMLGADFAWRADACSTSGGKTTQWNPYRGAAVLAQSNNLKRGAAPAAVASLGGRLSVTFALSYYTGTIALGNSHTVATVCRLTTNSFMALWSSTTGGTPSTGTDMRFGQTSHVLSTLRLGGSAASSAALSEPISAIVVAVLTQAGASLYVTAKTPTTNGSATAAIAQSGHALGSIQTTENFPFTGEIAEHAAWDRALSQAEVEALLTGWGRYYALTIGA